MINVFHTYKLLFFRYLQTIKNVRKSSLELNINRPLKK
jgi:hypothetical protein